MVKAKPHQTPSHDRRNHNDARQRAIRWALVAAYCLTAVEIFISSGNSTLGNNHTEGHFRNLLLLDLPLPGPWSSSNSSLQHQQGPSSGSSISSLLQGLDPFDVDKPPTKARKKCDNPVTNTSLLSTGALDEFGCPDYVHDVYRVKNNAANNNKNRKLTHDNIDICDEPLGLGAEGHFGYWGLNKIHIASTNNTPKVLCIVYTHSGLRDNLQSVLETWGSRCDGFLAASNETVPEMGAVHILHKGDESYGNMWQKVRSIWTYVHDHYIDEFDFFNIGGVRICV